MDILAKNSRTLLAGNVLHALRPPWWSGFLLALVLPCSTLLFLGAGPHGLVAALLWTMPVWLLIAADHWSPDEVRPIPRDAPRWFFDGILYALAALQLANLIALGAMVSRLQWSGPLEAATAAANLTSVRILAGSTFCCAVIAPAHELLHRRSRWQRGLGRLLLISVFYDQFAIAHRLGHHARLGGREDPSTAAPGESYAAFWRRSVSHQWRLAWQYQPRAMAWGLLLESALLGLYLAVFGGLAACMLGYVNLAAVRLLEAVNYFQHYALSRAAGRPAATAWRSASAVSLFLFLGLTRHTDHHRHAAKPYPALLDTPAGPQLAHGYLGMAIWVKNDDRSYRRWAMQALAASDGAAGPGCGPGTGAAS